VPVPGSGSGSGPVMPVSAESARPQVGAVGGAAVPQGLGPAQVTAVQQAIVQILAAIEGNKVLTERPRPGLLPSLDVAVEVLENLPRPERGDRKKARGLLDEGLAMMRQENQAVALQLLARAHLADPRDVQIVNDLAYAELRTGRLQQSREHLQQTLAMAPRRSSAWANLAELRVTESANDAAIADATKYLLVAYWFSSDRQQTTNFLNEKAEQQGNPALAAAARRALERIAAGARSTSRLEGLEMDSRHARTGIRGYRSRYLAYGGEVES
jgi:tetratricopeptide (TPR) repeat protein